MNSGTTVLIPNVAEESVSRADFKLDPTAAYFSWRKIAVLGSVGSAVLLAANAFVCATWSSFFDVPGWIAWQTLSGAVAIAFIPATILRFRSAHPALKVVYAISASWLGALNFAFFAALTCWIAEGAAWLAGWALPRFPFAAVLFGLAFLATAYGLINARRIRVNSITVRLPHLPEAWRGRTVALVTDLHLEPFFGATLVRRVVDRLRSLQPDAVFISGDMFDGPTLDLHRLLAAWQDLAPSRGIFYVTGNHEELAERNAYLDPIRSVGIHVLDNAKVSLDGLQLVGVHDAEAVNPAQLRSILQRVRIDRGHPSILLAHQPTNLSIAEEEGISLQLSGHTHQGQVWPWSLMVPLKYGPFGYGISWLGDLQVYTSSGAGTAGPPMRVGTRSEIVQIRLENQET